MLAPLLVPTLTHARQPVRLTDRPVGHTYGALIATLVYNYVGLDRRGRLSDYHFVRATAVAITRICAPFPRF